MTDVKNDCLALAQFITQSLSESQSISYLQAIEGLDIKQWKESKRHLPGVDPTSRHTKEGTIRDIVQVFKSDEVLDNYILTNLKLCPGFSDSCIQLVSFHLSSLQATFEISSRISNAHNEKLLHQKVSAEAPPRSTACSGHVPPVVTTGLLQTPSFAPHASVVTKDNTAFLEGFPKLPTGNINSQSESKQNKISKQKSFSDTLKSKNKWTVGTKSSKNTTISHQLKSVCLAVKSGHNETADSLKTELEEWKSVTNMKIEAVSANMYETMFRVNYDIPVALQDHWKETKVWPARMSANLWKGNPKSVLQPLNQRTYKKKIYMAGLSEKATETSLRKNLRKIYAKEIEDQTVKEIEIYFNQAALARAEQRKSRDPSYEVTRSACIVLTSHPGASLAEVKLMEDSYPWKIKRTLRHWRGQIPWPTGHQNSKIRDDLEW